MDSPESDKDVPKSADKDTNRRPMIKLIDGDDDSHSETPDTLKAKHMQEEVGQLRKKVPRWCHGHVDHRTRLLRHAGFYQRMKHAKDTMIPSTLGQWVVFGGLRRARGGSFSFSLLQKLTRSWPHLVSLFSPLDPQFWHAACKFIPRNITNKRNLLCMWLIDWLIVAHRRQIWS